MGKLLIVNGTTTLLICMQSTIVLITLYNFVCGFAFSFCGPQECNGM